MSASRQSSSMDSVNYRELGALMEQFPDWKNDHPDLMEEMYPQRFTKNKSYLKKDENTNFIKKRASTVPAVSDYQDTYRYHNLRPRSTKRPPQTPRDPHPPPMTLQSSQRAEYPSKFHEYGGRPPLLKQDDNYEPPVGKFQAQSAYQYDYPHKEPLPRIHMHKGPVGTLKREAGKFDGLTTNKECYRQWKPQTTFTFGELPTFTDSILYPSAKRSLETTTESTFKGVLGEKTEPARIASPNIKIEGGINFDTTNSLTYKKYDNARRSQPVVHKSELGRVKRSKFEGTTQSKRDFGSTYDHGVPRPPKPVSPLKASIDLKFDNRHSFETEQRNQYIGIDVEANPIPHSYKPEAGDYMTPTTKFETMTKHKMDYQPIDIKSNQVHIAKPPQARKDKDLPKFDGQTTTKEYFKKWDIQPRPYYGDIHEALQYVRSDQYVQQTGKFDATTTTRDNYKGLSGEMRDPFVPEETKFDTSGKMDFGTIYRNEFEGPAVLRNIPKKQAAVLLKELRRRKKAVESGRIQPGGMPVNKSQHRIHAK